jgi:hypothetical protein
MHGASDVIDTGCKGACDVIDTACTIKFLNNIKKGKSYAKRQCYAEKN